VKLITIVLTVLIAAMSFTGCGSGEAASVEETTPEACPDILILVNTAHLTSTLGENGRPFGDSRVFSADTAELFVSFEVYEDICCSTVVIHWAYGEEVISFWQGYSTIPPYVTLRSPEEGFTKGDYSVVMYIGIREVMRVPFIIA
jgi:hypothetical protein